MRDESGIEKALAALKSRNPIERLTAIETLAKNRYDGALDRIIAAASHDDNEDVREAAVWALGDIQDPEAGPFLRNLANDVAEPRPMRWAALYALGTIGDEEALMGVFHVYYADDDIELRQAAARTILRYGEKAAPALTEVLNNRRTRGVTARAAAAQLLGRIGANSAVDVLIKAIDTDEPHVRWDAVKALGDIGDSRAVPHLIRLLDGDDVLMGKIAVWALETISTTEAINAASRWREENEYYSDDSGGDQPPLLPPPRPDSYGPF